MSRKRRRAPGHRPAPKTVRSLRFESLERRELLAGGLVTQILNGSIVQADPNTTHAIEIAGNTAADTQNLLGFFNAANGSAGTTSFNGTLTVGGEAIQGALTLTENGATGGVLAVIAQGSLEFGATEGVRLSGGSGAFELYSTGAAGVLNAGSSANSVAVVGVKGLALSDTSTGLSFGINQTGSAVNESISTANGPISISFADGSSVLDVAGAVDLKVANSSGTVARVGGEFTMNLSTSGDGLSLAGQQVSVDFYKGSTRVVTLGSASAGFTLGDSGLALTANSFTVGAFGVLPAGQPVGAGAGNYSSTAMDGSATLGPISLVGASPTLAGLSFGPAGLVIDVGISATSGGLNFEKAAETPASGDSPTGLTLTTLGGTFDVNGSVDPNSGLVTGFSVPGAFAINVDKVDLNIPQVLDASASTVAISYDPGISGSQQVLTAGSVSVTVPALNLTGSLTSTSTQNGNPTPALVVNTDGFSFDTGTVSYAGTVSVGSEISVTNPSVTLGGFSFSDSSGASLNSFSVGADSVTVGSSTSPIQATGNTISATLGFDSAGEPNSFSLAAASVTATVGSYLSFSGTGVTFNPLATGSDPVLSLTTATATANIKAVGLSLTGTAGDLSIGADGSVLGPSTLDVTANFDGTTASKLKLPSYLPFQIQSLGLDWTDFAADPSDFTIDLSASVDGSYGPVTLSGGVQSLVIDPSLLAAGQFPIVDLSGFSVTAGGDLFGGTVSGTVIGGLVKLDALGNVLPDDSTSFASTVFYGGIEGSFQFGNIGASIEVGFSQDGLLDAYLSADVPVILDPESGLALTGFHGGISFDATPLPPVTDPSQLTAPIFQPTTDLTATQWQQQLEQQVANQVSGGSRIDTIVLDQSSIVSELNGGTIAAGGPTDLAFSSNGYALDTTDAGATTVTTMTANSLWEIQSQGSTYFVEQNNAGNLDVYSARFAMANSIASELTTSQSPSTVPADLVTQFASNNLVLDPTATIAATKTAGEWVVTDGSDVFYITTWGTGSTAVLGVTGGGASIAQANNVMRIEAGATLYDEYASENAFKATVDVIITTDGKFVIDGNLTLADSVSADVKIYGDLSSLNQQNPNTPLSLVFLADMPSGSDTSPLVEIQGTLTLEFHNASGQLVNPAYSPWTSLVFDLTGEATIGSPDTAALVIGGSSGTSGDDAEVKLTVTNDPNNTEVRLDVSGSLSIAGVIQASDLVSGAGTLILDKPANSALEFYGAIELNFDANSPGLSFLKEAGLSAANADLLLAVNSTSDEKDLTLTLPGRTAESLDLAPETLELDGTGTLQFANSVLGIGANISFDGAFAARISDESAQGSADHAIDLSLFVDGQLQIGLAVSGQQFNLLNLDALGLIDVQDIDITKLAQGTPVVPKLAARIDLTLQEGIPGLIQESGSMELLINTTGAEFDYVVPARLQATLDDIQAHEQDAPPGSVTLPPLPALIEPDGTVVSEVTVPAAPPAIKGGATFPAGPYFALQFGDPNDSIVPGSGDTNGNGLVNVHLDLLNTFDLYGNFRVVADAKGFEVDVDATATLKNTGAGNILDSEATGILSVSPDGFFGALGFETQIDLPGSNIKFADVSFAIGINTTNEPRTLDFADPNLSSQTIAPETGEVYAAGTLDIGSLAIAGSFELEVGAQELALDVNGSINVAGIPLLTVSGTADIYYGLSNTSDDGLVLDAALSLGNGNSIGVAGVFSIGGSLELDLDTRPSSYMVEIAVNDASLDVLSVINFTGSADVIFSGSSGFTVTGSFSGTFLDIFSVDASGSFSSDGDFDLNLSGGFQLGTHNYGVEGSASLYIDKQGNSLAFGGSASGEVRAFGVTLVGAGVDISYDSNSGKIEADAHVTVIGITKSVDFTVGYLTLDAQANPNLGSMNGGTLTLNVGALGSQRSVSSNETDESYEISEQGQTIIVSAFGSTQSFTGVTAITGDFGTGSDSVLIDSSVQAGVAISIKGEGDDEFTNESADAVTFDVSGSSGSNNVLESAGANSTLYGGSGADLISADGANDVVWAGSGTDTIDWTAGDGPATVHGGSGSDTLSIYGTDSSNDFSLDTGTPVNGQTPVIIASSIGGTASGAVTAFGIGSITVQGEGGPNSASVAAGDLASSGVTNLTLDLSQIEGSDGNGIDDGAVDSVTITGTSGADTFGISASGTNVNVTTGALTVVDQQPGAGDTLAIDSGTGNDTFNVAGTVANQASASQLVGLTLAGQGGNDTFNLPIGGATIDGGTGNSTANFSVGSADATTVTMTSTQVYSSSDATTLTRIANDSLTATTSASVTLQSTLAGSTGVTLESGGSLDVKGTSGPLTVTLGNASSSVLLESTGATTTITGTPGAGQSVTLGTGLLSDLGNVRIANVDHVTYNDSQDATGRTVTLGVGSVSVSGLSHTFSHAGAKTVEYEGGLGNDTINATAGAAELIVDGGAGTDKLAATLSDAATQLSLPQIKVGSGVESVSFTDTAIGSPTSWTVDNGVINGVVNGTGFEVLDASMATGSLAISLGGGNESVAIGRVPIATSLALNTGTSSVTIGGSITSTINGISTPYTSDLDNVASTLTLTSGRSGNSLTLDDLSAAGVETRSIASGVVTGTTQGGAITFSGGGFSSLQVDLGAGPNTLALSNLPTTTTVTGGAGSDSVTASGTLNNLAFYGYGGSNSLDILGGSTSTTGTVTDQDETGTGSATVSGSSNSLTIDDSSATANLTGSLTYLNNTQSAITIGSLSVDLSDSADVGVVAVDLGSGNDNFTIDVPARTAPATTYAPPSFTINGNAGNDTVTVQAVTGASGNYTINGGTGNDTVKVIVSAPPTADGLATAIVPNVENLIIDNSTDASTSGINWTVADAKVEANGYQVIDSTGAGQVAIIGGSQGADTLTVSGAAQQPVDGSVDGPEVTLTQGANVLSQPQGQATNSPTPVSTTINGLTGANAVATTPDGTLVFASGTGSNVAIFRRNTATGTLTFYQSFTLPIGNPTSLAVTPDGKQLLVSNSALNGSLYVYAIAPGVGITGSPTTFNDSNTIGQLVVSPDGKTILGAESTVSNSTQLIRVFIRNTLTGAISYLGGQTIAVPSGIGQISFSADSSELYVPNPSAGTVAVYANAGSGVFTPTLTASNSSGLKVVQGSQVQISQNGTFLFVYDAITQAVNYYRLPTNNDPYQITWLGSVSGVSGANNSGSPGAGNVFKYVDSSSVLVTLGSNGKSISSYNFIGNPGQFTLINTVALTYLNVQSIDAGVVAGSSNYGLSYVVASSPDDDNGATELDYFYIDNNGTIYQDSKTENPFGKSDNFTGPVAMIAPVTAGSQPDFVAAYNDGGDGYAVFGEDGNIIVNADADDGDQIIDLAAYSSPYSPNNSTTGLTSSWVSIERDPSGTNTYLKVFQLTNDTENGGSYKELYSDSLNKYLPDAERIRISNDGSMIDLIGASGAVATIPIVNLYNYGLDVDFTSIQVASASSTGLDIADLATSNGKVYAVTADSSMIAILTPNPSTGSNAFTSGGTTNLNNGFNAYNLAGASSVASSADDSRLYVTTQDGSLTTIGINTTTDDIINDGTMTFVSPTSGSDAAEVIRAGTNGDRLLIAFPSQDAVYEVTLTGPSGLPESPGIIEATDSTLAGADALSLVGGDLYVSASTGNAVDAITFNGTTLATTPFQKDQQGNVSTRSVAGLQATASTPDGRYTYGVSAVDGGVAIYDSTAQAWTSYFNTYEIPSGLAGASLVAATSDSGSDYGFALTPTSSVLSIFKGTSYLGQVTLSDFSSGVTAITASSTMLYVATASQVYAYNLSTLTTKASTTAAPSVTSSTKTSLSNTTFLEFHGTSLYAFSNAATPHLVTYDAALVTGNGGSITGLAAVTSLVFYGNDAYASSSSTTGSLYHLSVAANGNLTLQSDTYANGFAGVHGLAGGSAVAVSSDGRFVFVASQTGNSIAVFSRNSSTGVLTFDQLVLDGRGANGLTAPTGLSATGSTLTVASDAGLAGNRGGLATLNITTSTVVPAIQYVTSFQKIAALALNGGTAADTFQVLEAAGVPLTISGGGGGDLVNIADLGGSGALTTVDFGTGSNELDIQQTVAQSTAGSLVVNSPSGTDTIDIQSLGNASNATINATNAATDDVINILGTGLAATSSVTVRGAVAVTSNSVTTGPALIYNGQGTLSASSPTSGTISQSGSGSVNFTNLDNGTGPQQVFVLTSPISTISIAPAVPGQPIAEGNGVILTAQDTLNLPGDTFAWDLTGNGQYTDATGSSVTLSWAQLQSLGINTAGNYPIAVRVTTTQNTASFGGQTFQASAEASAVLNIAYTPPTITVPIDTKPSGNATVGVPFSLALQEHEFGTEPVTSWMVNWGDGTPGSTYDANATSASHVYTSPGTYSNVSITVYQRSLMTTATGSVAVNPGAGTVSLSAPSSINAGDTLAATATALGSPTFTWTISGQGVNTTLPVTSASLSVPFSALGLVAGGSYTLTATATYSSGNPNTVSASSPVTVVAIAPTGVVAASVPTVPQGSLAGAVTLSVGSISDPAPGSATPSYTVSYAINGVAVTGGQNVAATTPFAVPASLLSTPGTDVVVATLTAPNGLSSSLSTSFTVTPVAPTLSLSNTGPIVINEGGVASFNATVSGPGASVSSWLVTWGDGTTTTLAGTSLTQGFSHTYGASLPDNATFPIVVTATTGDGDVTASTPASVTPVAPVVTLSTTTPSVTEGAANAYILDVQVVEPGTVTTSSYTVSWGDGGTTTVPGDTTSLEHTYASAGTFPVSVTALTNSDGTYSSSSNTLTATVIDAPPVIATSLLQIPSGGTEGTPLDFDAVATSVATGIKPLTYTWTVTEPDGQAVTLPPTSSSAPYLSGISGYQYASSDANLFTPETPGAYTIGLVVTDGEGGQTSVNQAVTVADLAPTITSFDVPTSNIAAFQTLALSAAASKPDGLYDPLTYTWTITEQATGDVQTLSGPTTSFTPRNGTYSVQLAVTDQYGGLAAQSATLTAADPGPSIPNGGLSTPPTGLEGGSGVFTIAATDPDPTTPLAYAWSVVDPLGNLTQYSGSSVPYSYTGPGTYDVTVTATDSAGLTAVASASVAVAPVPPTITSATIPTAASQGVPVQFSSAATDPGGALDPLGYTWTILGPGNSTTLLAGPSPTFTPPDHGSYAVSLSVSDSYGLTTTESVGTLNVADVAPVLGPIALPAPIVEGQTATFTVSPATAVAAELATIQYNWTVVGPDGTPHSFLNQGTSLTYSFPVGGNYAVSVSAVETSGLASKSTAATVAVADLAPTITGLRAPTSGYVGFALSLAATATDVPGDVPGLAYSWTITPPTGKPATFGGPTLSYTPTAAGTYGVSLTVTDPEGLSSTQSASISVAASPVTIASLTLPTGSVEASSVGLQAVAVDALGGSITYTWSVTGPGGQPISVVGSGGNVSFVPPIYGNYAVSLKATSPDGQAMASGTVAVADVAPTIQQITLPGNSAVNIPVQLSVQATDPGGTAEPLTYTWTITSPSGTPFGTLNGAQASFTPTQLGNYGIHLVVSEAGGGSASDSRLLPVLAAPPVASAGGPYSVNEGSTVQLNALLGTTDSNQAPSTLTYAWDFTGNGQFTDATGPTPTFSAANLDGPSSATVRVRVTDSYGDSSIASATINILDVAPTITSLTPSASTINEGSSVSLTGAFTDPGVNEAHTVTVNWGDGSAATVLSLGAGVLSFTTPNHTYLDNPTGVTTGGSFAAGVVISDSGGATSTATSRSIVVNDVAPTASIAGDTAGTFGQTRTFTISATDPSPVDTAAGFGYSVNWGDGTSNTYSGGSSLALTHNFASAGTFTVTVQATDKDGLSGVQASSKPVAIAKANPTFTLVAPALTYNGAAYSAASAEAYGVNGADLGAATITYYLSTDTGLTTPIGAPIGVGSYLAVANYAGSANYNAGQSSPSAFAINKRTTTVTLSPPTPTAAGQSVSFVATVSTGLAGLVVPTGDLVQFKIDGVNSGSPVAIAANGTATYTTSIAAAGSHAITASYIGDANLLGSTSNSSTATILGPGLTVIGSTLYVVGASTSDYAQISPAGSATNGSTGLEVSATLNNVWTSKTFLQTFTAISIFGGDGNDNFQIASGLPLPVTAVEGNGNDYIQTGSGNDNFTFGTGSDQVFGGTGNKTVVANDVAGTSSYYSFGNGNHTLNLGQGNDQIFAGTGNNSIRMLNGTDVVSVGDGTDYITLGKGNDYVHAGNGAVTLVAGDGTDNIQLGNGADTVTLGNGNDYVAIGTGNDTVTAGDGADNVQLGGGTDTISLGNGNDYVSACNGNDTVTVGNGNDNIQLGDGNDVIVEGNGNDYVHAGNGSDLVVGGLGQHTIQLGNGNDILIDGSVTLTNPGDSLRQILLDWDSSSSTSVNSRIKVTYNVSHPNGLTAGSGRNWFFYTDPQDWTNKKFTDRLN